jgi:hypothetical protein
MSYSWAVATFLRNKIFHPLEIGIRQLQRRLGLLEAGVGGFEFRFKRGRFDDEQHVPLFHHLAIFEFDLLQVSADAGFQIDFRGRPRGSRELDRIHHAARDGRRHGHFRRRRGDELVLLLASR